MSKNWLNQHVTHTKKKNKNRNGFVEMSGREGKLELFWCFQTSLDLMSKLKLTEHNFERSFKNLTNQKDFCLLLPNSMVGWTITFKTYKMS